MAGAVYHEATDSWIVPQNDPYTLANFQMASDHLAARRSAATDEFAAAPRLEATHYALRIYPRNEEQQWAIERMEDVQVAYIPFDYVRLSEPEAEPLAQARSAAVTFAEKSPYTVTYDNYDATDGGSTEPVTLRMPILYTVWPVDKPLPEELDHVVDYEIFLPPREAETRRAALSPEAMQALENEALGLALGRSMRITFDPNNPGLALSMIVFGTVQTYDDLLGRNVPLSNLKVRSQVGSSIKDSHTDSSGNFTAYAPLSSSSSIQVPLTFIYQDQGGRWIITAEYNGTIPHSVTTQASFLKINSSQFTGYSCQITLSVGDRQANVIHRAANYFYNHQTTFPRHSRSKPLSIFANSNSGGSLAGEFNSSITRDRNDVIIQTDSYIVIYNAINDPIATTLHELGHAEHFQYNPDQFSKTHYFLKESYASYASWYLWQEYYKSFGWVHPGGNPSLLSQEARQTWTKTTNSTFGAGLGTANRGWYSPLFVDLTDDYNQSTASVSRPNDTIKDVPASVVWSTMSTSTNWAQCRQKLQNYVGIYYTSTEFNNWIGDFDYWNANYN